MAEYAPIKSNTCTFSTVGDAILAGRNLKLRPDEPI